MFQYIETWVAIIVLLIAWIVIAPVCGFDVMP